VDFFIFENELNFGVSGEGGEKYSFLKRVGLGVLMHLWKRVSFEKGRSINDLIALFSGSILEFIKL